MIPRWVEAYLEIPFVLGGRDRRGCDCFGLVRLVLAREAGVELPDYGWIAAADRRQVMTAIAGACADEMIWRRVPIGEARAFDVVVMAGPVALQNGQTVWAEDHVGVMVSPRHVLHTEDESGPSCAAIADRALAPRLLPRGRPIVRRHFSLGAE